MGANVDIEKLARVVVDCAYKIHCELGPGLLESVYEAVMAKRLRELGFQVERQKSVSFRFDGIEFEEGFRADLVIEGILLVELKSIERLLPVNGKQVLTYLRLLDLKLGILINFGGATFREGVRRIVNNHTDTSSSSLRIHEQARD